MADGFCQDRLRVNHAFPEAVTLRPQPGLTGSGSYGPSYGGFGEDTRTSTRMLAVGRNILTILVRMFLPWQDGQYPTGCARLVSPRQTVRKRSLNTW